MDENREDQPLSSEELLRRARQGLGDTETTPEPPADFKVGSSPPPPPDVEPEVPAAISEPESPTVPRFDPPVVESPPPSDPSSWAPPPAEPTPDPVWSASTPPAAGPVPTEVKKGGGGLRGKLWILVVLVVAGFALFSFLDTSKTVDEISIGDCFNMPEDDVFYEIDPIDCTEEHDLEVFALIDLSVVSPRFSAAAAYPGDDAVYDAAHDACWDEFESYIGVPYEDSVLFMDAFTPTLEGWNEVDDRIVNCVLFEVNDDASAIVKSSAPLRNAGR